MIRSHGYFLLDPLDWSPSVSIRLASRDFGLPMISHSSKAIFPSWFRSASSTSSNRCDTRSVSICKLNELMSLCYGIIITVAQSPMAYTSPRGAPFTRRCASTSIAFLWTWLGRRLDTRAVNGFIAIPVDHNTKFAGIVCSTTLPVSGSLVV